MCVCVCACVDVELGVCGSVCVSAALAVVATERESAMPHLRRNVARNAPSAPCPVSTHTLNWCAFISPHCFLWCPCSPVYLSVPSPTTTLAHLSVCVRHCHCFFSSAYSQSGCMDAVCMSSCFSPRPRRQECVGRPDAAVAFLRPVLASVSSPPPPLILFGTDLLYSAASHPLLAAAVRACLVAGGPASAAYLLHDDDCVPNGKDPPPAHLSVCPCWL